jgi:hypothetical protein
MVLRYLSMKRRWSMFVQILDALAAQVASFCAPMITVKAMLMFVGLNIVENAHIVETAVDC